MIKSDDTVAGIVHRLLSPDREIYMKDNFIDKGLDMALRLKLDWSKGTGIITQRYNTATTPASSGLWRLTITTEPKFHKFFPSNYSPQET